MDKKVLYFPINKCACTSFKKLFEGCDNIIVPNLNLEDNNNLHLIKNDFDKYYKFAIIRHPISRFLSAVNMFIRDGKIKKKYAVYNVLCIMKKHKKYDLDGSKYSYIKRHTLPLTHELYCIYENNKIIPDYIVKLEEFDKNTVFNKLNIDINKDIPRENKTTKYITKDNLTRGQLRFLYNYYKKDFEVFYKD